MEFINPEYDEFDAVLNSNHPNDKNAVGLIKSIYK